ncbi:MAG: hypothetical protein ACK4QW_05710 [Alphaproteobacteria bacterium]
MKRLHVHVSVEDMSRSVGFYSTPFASPPAVLKPDYARWMRGTERAAPAVACCDTAERARV